MVRWYLGHMTDPRSRRTNHKAQVLLAHAHWAPAVMPSAITEAGRQRARLDRGTGKIKQKLCGSKSGYLSNSGTRSPPPQRSAVICTVRSCRREELSVRPGILTWWRQKYRSGRFTFAP
ncbi:unnamed protein product [Staurois parvus]|uniref:Uncharacterized protein n=1 Tax=Staurois parvus TaxID=386267 RepID=A0ABN9F2I8_9NEOB|nr:unnamed protein product [Staurois parvus]